jgi:hypothetical protein
MEQFNEGVLDRAAVKAVLEMMEEFEIPQTLEDLRSTFEKARLWDRCKQFVPWWEIERA